MEQVIMLKQVEVVQLDPLRLDKLYRDLGETAAENVVCRALEELAVRLSHIERCSREGRIKDLQKSARSLIVIADQIGMGLVSCVTRDVLHCVESGDQIALGATLSRLVRIGERSLSEIWEVSYPVI